MGRSLDELIAVGYLSAWDIRPMITKDGYKLVLQPGQELLHVLAISQRKQLCEQQASEELNESQHDANSALLERGVSPAKAALLVKKFNPSSILDQIEYAEFLMSKDRRRKFENPAGFIIYTVENNVPVPTEFATTRKTRQQQQRALFDANQQIQTLELQRQYEDWVSERVDKEMKERFAATALKAKIKETIKKHSSLDERFAQMLPIHQEPIALQFLKRDISEQILLPSFEEWKKSTDQLGLFSSSSE
jgi:ATP-dependent Lon protease